jgi:hypothetical protein
MVGQRQVWPYIVRVKLNQATQWSAMVALGGIGYGYGLTK